MGAVAPAWWFTIDVGLETFVHSHLASHAHTRFRSAFPAPPRTGPDGRSTAQDPKLATILRRERMRQTGTVKFFNVQKGFGFITPDEGGKDVFVHVTAVERSGVGSLTEGMRISFETEPDKRGKGPKAVNLQPA